MSILEENVISLHEAAAVFPGRQPGKKLAFSTVWRWALKGIRAATGETVRLEAARLGARWVTSKEAIHRFSAALTPSIGGAEPLPTRTPTARQRAADRAAERLEAAGI